MSRSLLLFLGAVALGGGVFYLYKSGKLVGAPAEMGQGVPLRMMRVSQMTPLEMSGYAW